ncbi:MAG: AmpG family muropeptide MFS transporter [Candidatus Portiera sp.]|nr:AmpG family muropeptide MFS transporter [Portiera sp.]
MNSLSIYFEKRMAGIFVLGIMQGFPWVLIGATLSLWLKEEGFTRSSIGLFGLLFSVYSINFLWAPLLDRIRVPWLSDFVGQRRAWVLIMQAIIFIAMLTMFTLDPQVNLWMVAFCALVIATSSATQDIALDALRIDIIGNNESDKMAAAAALMVAGWWTAFKLGGAISLYLASYYQNGLGIENYWPLVYLSLTGIVILSNIAMIWFIKSPDDTAKIQAQKSYDEQYNKAISSIGVPNSVFSRVIAWLLGTVVSPLWSFFKRNGVGVALAILGFILLFKMGEAFLGKMSILFYSEVGFTKEEIAIYSKTLGWVATIVFSIVGGLINARFGLIPAVFISGIAMATTNLLFAVLALAGPNTGLFAVAIIADDFTGAVSTVTFVAFISQLCDKTFSATQYALMASIAAFGRNTLASFSGIFVDKLEGFMVTLNISIAGAGAQNSAWALFFIITTFMVIPSLVLLWLISDKLQDAFASAKTKIL